MPTKKTIKPEQPKLTDEFHRTCWELVQHQPNLKLSAVRNLFLMAKERWIGSIQPTTPQAFKQWVTKLETTVNDEVPWKVPVLALCKRIVAGEFSGSARAKEYRYKTNRKAKGGYDGNSSAAGGLMSSFYQAMSYDHPELRTPLGVSPVFPPAKEHVFSASDTCYILVSGSKLKKKNSIIRVRIDHNGNGSFSVLGGKMDVSPIMVVVREFDTIARKGTGKVWRVRVQEQTGTVFFQEVGKSDPE